MHSRTAFPISAVLALALTAVSIANSGPGSGVKVVDVSQFGPSSFDVSSEFTGTLAGEILVGGTSYRLAPEAQLYEIGRGLMPSGTLVANRRVFFSGLKRGGIQTIYTVIVRPADDMWSRGSDPASHVGVMDDATPR